MYKLFLFILLSPSLLYASSPVPYNKTTGNIILKKTQKYGIQDEDLLNLLINTNPDLNIRDEVYKGTPLWASIKNRYSTVKILLKYQAKVDVQDKMGNTPLMGASKLGFIDIVRLLIQYSPDINYKNTAGKDAIDLAEEGGHMEVVEILQAYKGDVPEVDPNDFDGDGISNSEDTDDDNDGYNDSTDSDKDNDGLDDKTEDPDFGNGTLSAGTNKWKTKGALLKNFLKFKLTDNRQADIDMDGVPDSNDDDIDGDGIKNSQDKDADGDGKLDATEDIDKGTGEYDAGISKLNSAANIAVAIAKFRTKGKGKKIENSFKKKEEANDKIIEDVKNTKGDTRYIINIINSKGMDLEHRDDNYNATILYFAILNKDWNLVKFLLEKSANPNVQDKNGYTPLMRATEYGDDQLVILLLSYLADVNYKTKDGKDALSLADQNGHSDILDLLRKYKNLVPTGGNSKVVNPSDKDNDGIDDKEDPDKGNGTLSKGTLSWRAGARMLALKAKVQRLIKESELNRNKGGGNELLALIKSSHKDFELINFIKVKKPDLDYRDPQEGDTALIVATDFDKESFVKILLENGINPNLTNRSGDTALMRACILGHYNIVALLLKYGVDINYKNKSGDDAISLAKKNNHKDILDLLLKYKQLVAGLFNKNTSISTQTDPDADGIDKKLDRDNDNDGLDDKTEDPDGGTGKLSSNTNKWRSVSNLIGLKSKVDNLVKIVPKPNVSPSAVADISIDPLSPMSCSIGKRGNIEVAYVKTMKIRMKTIPRQTPKWFLNLSGKPVETGKVCQIGSCNDVSIFTFKPRNLTIFNNKQVPLGPQMRDFIQVYEGVPGGKVLRLDITKCRNFRK